MWHVSSSTAVRGSNPRPFQASERPPWRSETALAFFEDPRSIPER
jgi:hypothetical protein